jgi:hypothetical protein
VANPWIALSSRSASPISTAAANPLRRDGSARVSINVQASAESGESEQSDHQSGVITE